MWKEFDSGLSINEIGSEKGIIIKDEEHSLGARITLEKNGYAPFSITCGIYGLMAHTVFFGDINKVAVVFESMKNDIHVFLESDVGDIYATSKFCESFIDKYV